MKKWFIIFFILVSAKIYAQDTIYYKIERGATLYKISTVCEVPIADIKALNNLKSETLTIGQTLKIYNQKKLSESKIAINTIVYNRERTENKITSNNNLLSQKTELLSAKSAILTDEKDLQQKLDISRQKAVLKDSIQKQNKLLESEISKFNTEIDSLQAIIKYENSIEDKDEVVVGKKTKEDIKLTIEQRAQELKEKEEAKKIADKLKEKEKKDKEKAKKTAAKEKELAKKEAEKIKVKEKNDREKARKIAVKEKEKAKKLAEKEKAKTSKPKVEKVKETKVVAVEKEKKVKLKSKVKEEIVVEEEKIEKAPKQVNSKETEVEEVKNARKDPKEIQEKPQPKAPKIKEEIVEETKEDEKLPKENKNKTKEAKTDETVIAEVDKVTKEKVKTKEAEVLEVEKSAKGNKEKPQVKEPETIEVKKDIEPKVVVKEKKVEVLDSNSLDSLQALKSQNLIFLDEKIESIEVEKSSLNPDLDLLRILFLSKEKFLVTDSINKLNAAIDVQLANSKLTEKPVKTLPKEIKEVKIEKPIEQTLVFDNDIKIDTAVIAKEVKEKIKAKEIPVTSDLAKDTSQANITVNVKPVVIESSKKKKKFVIGDVVDKQLQEKAKFYLSRAKLEIDKPNINKAIEYLDKSIDLNPSYADAYVLKGDIYSSMTYYEKALSSYGRASFLEPRNAQINYNLGNCFIRLGKDNLAIEQWTKAIQNDSTYILAYAGRASLFMKNKNFEAAVNDYNKIFSINKYFYMAYKGRGVAHLELGHFGKAIIDFNNFLEFEPNDDYVYYKRGLAKLSDNEIYGGCIDLLSSSDLGNKDAEKALRKHCEK